MFDLIAKVFVKNHNDVKDPAVRSAYGTMTSIFGIVVNVLLFAVKFIVGTLFMSVSIRGDAINNLSDALSSVISLISFKMSNKPADREHPFGHARIEYIASMIVSFLIIHISLEQFRESFDKIMNPTPSQFSVLTVAVLLVSILAKLWMYLFNRAMGKKIGSLVMQANAADSISDVLGTSAVLLSLFIAKLIDYNIDGYMGIIVGVLILISGLKILNDAKNSLLGEAPDNELVEQITADVMSHPEVLGIHDIVVHNYGAGMHFATLHVEVDGKADLFESHDVVDNIERELSEKYNIHCSCHLDPIVTDDPNSPEEYASTELERMFKPLFNELGIDIVISGHTHRHIVVEPGERGNDYPILTNDNEDVMLVNSDKNGIRIKIVSEKDQLILDRKFK